jgi:hypothetical protein
LRWVAAVLSWRGAIRESAPDGKRIRSGRGLASVVSRRQAEPAHATTHPEANGQDGENTAVTEAAVPTGPCRNCGDATPGNFCPVCGQRRADVRVSLRRLLADVLEDQLSISSALPRTLVAVLFRPGHATNEYLGGRMASYIAPFRLYLVSSLVFFLLLSLQTRWQEMRALTAPSVATQSAPAAGDTLIEGAVKDSSSTVSLGRGLQISFGSDTAGGITGIDRLDAILEERLERLGEMESAEATAIIIPGVLERMPVAVFLLVPLFAVLLKLLYVRSRRYYVEHFIFALHVHAFAFILFSLMLPGIAVPGNLSRFTILILMVYLLVALKRVYKQGWFRTTFKLLVLSGAYSLALGMAMAVAVMIAIVAM